MSVEIDLDGRVVLVTGGTKGIGASIATDFLRAGAQVYVCSRNRPEELPSFDGRIARFLPADVRDPDQVDELIAGIVRGSGRLDTVVNNAGGAPPTDTVSASIRFHSKVVELNLIAPLLVSQRAWPVLRDNGGSIVMISSIAARRAAPGIASYAAAKAGLDNLTRTLAFEFAPSVRVNSVTVGLTRTDAYDANYGDDTEFASAIPMQRLAEPFDVAQACVFLASPMASYVTGTAVTVDGGGEIPEYLNKFRTAPESGN